MDYQEIMLMRDNKAKEEAKSIIREHAERQRAISEEVDKNAIWNKLASLGADDDEFLRFKKKVTDAFVVEGLTIFVDNCVEPVLIREEYNQKLVRQMVSAFVNEEGASNLLNKMKRTSYLMSELAYVTEQTIQSVLEGVDKNNSETFKIDEKAKDEFYDKLGKVDVDEAVGKITDRVKAQVEDFKTENMAQKVQLSSALAKTQQKVDKVQDKLKEKANDEKAKMEAEKLTEAYIADGKRRAVDIRENRTKTVFEHLVYNLAKTSMINESARQVFVEDSQLNMDKIVDHCEILTTFVTALDSAKLIKLDEAYIRNMINDFSK